MSLRKNFELINRKNFSRYFSFPIGKMGSILCLAFLLCSCATSAPRDVEINGSKGNYQAGSHLENRSEILDDLVRRQDFLGIFKKAAALRSNNPKYAEPSNVSAAVEAYLKAHAQSGADVYALLQKNGFETAHKCRPEKIPPGACEISKKCDEVVAGVKNVGARYFGQVTLSYRVTAEFNEGKLRFVTAYVWTH